VKISIHYSTTDYSTKVLAPRDRQSFLAARRIYSRHEHMLSR